MIRYVVAGVPRRDLLGALVVLGVALAALWSWPSMWRTLGLAVVVLVAYAAWTMDEPAAAIVDTTPTSLRRRTAARLLVLLPAALVWLAFAVLVTHRPWFPAAGTAATLGIVGVGGLLLGATAALVQRRRGIAAPGTSVATGVGLLVAALGAFPRHLPFHPAPFPGTTAREWAWSGTLWSVVAVGSVLVLLFATGEGRVWPGRGRPRDRAA